MAPALLNEAANALPPNVFLGTSSWSFPGWQGLLYREHYSNAQLARDGLRAYAASRLLRGVGIDRSFYAPLSIEAYRRYASQVDAGFRFIVKAPASVCDGAVRGGRGVPTALNSDFLNVDLARDTFVQPCVEGLGARAGALVFQLSPMPDALLADPHRLIDRLAAFFDRLPRLDNGTVYALEIRDASLLTPRMIRMLREHGVRYCVGIHSRMPDAARQAAALAMLDDGRPGPLIVRWSLHAGLRHEGATARYEPFDALVDPDVETREALAMLVVRALHAKQSAFVIVNNNAEGSSPLSCAWLALAIADAQRKAHSNAQSNECGSESPSGE